MFYSITGEIIHTAVDMAVVEAGGVGYACLTSSSTLGRLRLGQKATLFTHLNVREDAVDLYGFATHAELAAFRLLLGVSGVGPKAALALLSVNSPDRLTFALMAGDEKALTAAAGVGKKLAQRIILELKDKFGAISEPAAGTGAVSVPMGHARLEAQAALTALGYTPTEAAMAVKGFDEDMSAEDMIRAALKKQL